MNKRTQFDSARVIAEIRRLQLERARIETQRAARVLERARTHEQQMGANLDAHFDGWRNALLAPAGLSPALALNWSGAVASVQAAHRQAQQETRDAAMNADEQRIKTLYREQQSDHAETNARYAQRRFRRAHEEQQASRVEDMVLSHRGHS
jgi:hypothetical protein